MSIIKSLQDWLSTYDGMELRPLSDIKTDRPEDALSSYALASTGNSSTLDIIGHRTYKNSYVFYAKEEAGNEADRRDTNDFLENLREWIEQQNDSGHLPVLAGGYTVESVESSNGMLLDLYDDGTGLYQVQIQLTFTKE